MVVKILASGSSGNSTYLKTSSFSCLIDVGISKKKIEEALNKVNDSLINIKYIFITHEHIDHIKGLLMVLKHSNAIIYLTKGTLEALLKNKNFYEYYNENEKRFIILEKKAKSYENVVLSKIIITPLNAYHDALEPVGYLFNDNDIRVCYLTDTGYVHQEVMNLINNCDCYIFETNHDPEILMNSNRPYLLKKRILSDYGHLSNADSIYALANLVGPKTRYIFCAHISAECNLREIIKMTYDRIFLKLGIDNSKINLVMTMPTDIEEVIL